MSRWVAPISASRAGSAHLRAGRPCQDAVLCSQLLDTEGQPVMLMAVGAPAWLGWASLLATTGLTLWVAWRTLGAARAGAFYRPEH